MPFEFVELIQHSSIRRPDVAAGFSAAAAAVGGLSALHRITGASTGELSLIVREQVRPELSALVDLALLRRESLVQFLAHDPPPRRAAHAGGRPSVIADSSRLIAGMTRALSGLEPPSLRALARELGTTPERLRRTCPSRASALVARYRLWLGRRARARERRVIEEMRLVCVALAGTGIARRSVVERLLEKPGVFRASDARKEYRRLARTLSRK